ncbi:putative UDP-rhamnose:rhamnosyltransferase 1 [Sesamum indicum]|uniref:UDP-rhamnose:rhamnosyltransferase 1 n=1 Tax=Sesamum indicum TaxID=4182 RepID=A0A6I9U335_SESIN|nr:putative UDP-rhamnose:rhamnosyltransferase 1 [Sesamum indicum]
MSLEIQGSIMSLSNKERDSVACMDQFPVKTQKWRPESTMLFVSSPNFKSKMTPRNFKYLPGKVYAGIPFLWVVRKPEGDDNDIETLQPGFSSLMAGQGMLHIEWAPQREILGHPSIGGPFFHAGCGF